MHLETPLQIYFYVYSKQSKSNPNQSEKYPGITKVSKKEIDKYPWYYILFNFSNKNTSPSMFSVGFPQIF